MQRTVEATQNIPIMPIGSITPFPVVSCFTVFSSFPIWIKIDKRQKSDPLHQEPVSAADNVLIFEFAELRADDQFLVVAFFDTSHNLSINVEAL